MRSSLLRGLIAVIGLLSFFFGPYALRAIDQNNFLQMISQNFSTEEMAGILLATLCGFAVGVINGLSKAPMRLLFVGLVLVPAVSLCLWLLSVTTIRIVERFSEVWFLPLYVTLVVGTPTFWHIFQRHQANSHSQSIQS